MTDTTPSDTSTEATQAPTKGEFPSRAHQFKPGQSGNPAGMKKGTKHRSTILSQYLGATFKDPAGRTMPQPFGIEGPPCTVEEAIDVALVVEAVQGNVAAIREIKDTIHGKPTQIIGEDPERPFQGAILPPLEVTINVVTVEYPARGRPANHEGGPGDDAKV